MKKKISFSLKVDTESGQVNQYYVSEVWDQDGKSVYGGLSPSLCT